MNKIKFLELSISQLKHHRYFAYKKCLLDQPTYVFYDIRSTNRHGRPNRCRIVVYNDPLILNKLCRLGFFSYTLNTYIIYGTIRKLVQVQTLKYLGK